MFPFLFLCLLPFPVSRSGDLRIIGGNKSLSDKWPSVAALFHNGQHFCGGVVWNDRYILTAAHCLCRVNSSRPIRPGPITVYLGHTNFTQMDSDYLFSVEQIITHRRYNPQTWANDVALLRLSRQIDFARNHLRVRCVCEPLPLEILDLEHCVAIGWGSTRPVKYQEGLMSNDLIEVELPVLTARKCSRLRFKFNSHFHVCSMAPDGGKDACSGDSGGPLLCPIRNLSPPTYSLVGLTSFGSTDCGAKGEPGFFTHVKQYLYWIGKNAGDY